MSRAATLMVGLLALGVALPARAAIHQVTDCGDSGAPGQLRTLLVAAGPGDTILLPPCQITLAGGPGDDLNLGGDLDVTALKRLVVRGSGAGRTILAGGGADRVLHLKAGSHLTLAALSIRGGRTPDDGGGILVEATATLELSQVEVSDNQADGHGGGIANFGILAIRESTLSGNRALSGGGLFIDLFGRARVDRTTVSGNGGDPFGGGIVNGGNSLVLVQSTVSGNVGAGVATGMAGTTILHSTITGNTPSPSWGGGVLTDNASTVVRSSIVAGNLPADCAGVSATTSAGFNLQGDGSCGFAGPGDRTVADPGLGPLAANGGPTSTHALLPGSPARDAAPGAGCPPFDQRLRPRPAPSAPGAPPRCDIGAVEIQGADREAPPAKIRDPR